MFCRRCGKYNSEDNTVCTHCGEPLEKNDNNGFNYNQQRNYYQSAESKTGLGFLCGLFLGLIGLIIGLCLYPSNTTERETFIRGWGWSLLVGFVVGIIVAMAYCSALSALL